MSRRQRRCLIEKKQFRVTVGLHHGRAMTALELEHAGDPLPARPTAPSQRAIGQVKSTAAIAHQQTTMRSGDDVAFGSEAVVEWHGAICNNAEFKQRVDISEVCMVLE